MNEHTVKKLNSDDLYKVTGGVSPSGDDSSPDLAKKDEEQLRKQEQGQQADKPRPIVEEDFLTDEEREKEREMRGY